MLAPNRIIGSRLVCLLVGLLLLGPSSASEMGLKKVVEIEGITEYRMENGLRVLLFPDPSKPTVTVNITYFVGSRHEGYGETGMAHLLEHMLFKGTPSNPRIDQELQKRGATNKNGTTWVDRTNYYETLPAGDDNLEYAIRLEADRMINSTIKGEDLASEMTVVRNEFERGEDQPYRILSQRMAAVAYEWHNYGKSTIGNRSDIERVPLPRLRTFYRKHYQPDNAMLVVAGQFDREKALAHVGKYFGAIPRPERELDKTYTDEPPQDGERTVVLRRVGETGWVGVQYHVPASAHNDFAPISVMATILAMEPAGRLYKTLIETKKATAMYGYAYPLHDPGYVKFMAQVRKDASLREAQETLIETVEGVAEEGVKQEEVDRAVQSILKHREQELSDSERLAISLSEWAAQGDWRLYFLYRDRVEKVTPEDVKRVAAKYLRRSNRTVGVFIPTDEPQRVRIPSTPDVQALVKDYKGRETIAAGEQFDPSPENIQARTEFTRIEGVKVAFLPKKTRGEVVNLNLTLRFGDAKSLKGKSEAASVMPALMTRGTKNLTHQEIQDQLDSTSSSLSGSGGLGAASFRLKTKREHLPAMIKLLTQVLREPSFPADELEVIRRASLAKLESSLTDPQSLSLTKLRRLVSPYAKDHVNYRPTISEKIERTKALKLEDIEALYDGFLSAEVGELAIVGDFDPMAIKPLLGKMLADWPGKKPFARIPDEADVSIKGSKHVIETPDRKNSWFWAAQLYRLDDSHPDYPALIIGNRILGGGGLASRLMERVRQKDGLSYGIFSGLHARALDKRTSFTIGAMSNPQNTPKVAKAVHEELERFLKDGVTQEELNREVQGYLRKAMVDRADDGGLASVLGSLMYLDRTMQHFADREAKIAALTAEDIAGAWRRHLDLERLIVVMAGDFEGATEESGETQ